MADHFVIDGSNLATEGRTEPSLAQLKEAVAAFRAEHSGASITVVVDASFEHRIDPSERAEFATTEAANDVVSPPAGAVGRGDGFLLKIADRIGGSVLSNDSFQEFHAEYDWLFEPGRLIGGKPVPGVGWIFSLRRPVRGIVSRKTIQKAKQGDGKATKPDKKVQKAIAEATASAMQPDSPKRRRRRGGRGRSSGKAVESEPEPVAVNEPAKFLQFVIDHRLGTEVEGTVDAFASHGAFVVVDGVKCYVPLSAMGNPQPNRARRPDQGREAHVRGAGRRRAAPRHRARAPRFATVAGAPSEETVAAEVRTRRSKPKKAAPEKAAAKSAKQPAKQVAKKVAKKAEKAQAKAAPKKTPRKGEAAPAPAKKTKQPASSPAKQAKQPAAKKSAKQAKQQPATSTQQPAKKAKQTAKRSGKQAAKQAPGPAKKARKRQ